AVGAGTFKPVTAGDTDGHVLDAEEIAIPPETARAASLARSEGRRVVAVGTTVTRALEAAARRPGGLAGAEGEPSPALFITPGFEFRAVDALLTTFHPPRSTLLMLVCAFAGRESVLSAYATAVREGYLFYSFGDAMLVA